MDDAAARTEPIMGRRPPEAAGFDPDRLAAAVAFAEASETPFPRDLSSGIASVQRMQEPPPWNAVLGPTKDRGGASGVIVKDGAIVAEWGEPARVDMTYSATKSYLALLTGVAVDRGLIRDVDDPVRDYVLDEGFDAPQNRSITWRHLLQQTSEWEGSLWDKPDLVDRNRQVGVGVDNSRKGTHRDLQPPGSFWEYNDVRVNRLSLCLLQVFRRPLPDVLREAIMDPICASGSWEWHPYRNSYFEIDGRPLPSVPGGAHWGGGLWISSLDHARVGQLVLQRGAWAGRQLLPASWIDACMEPCALKPDYGFLWWLNTGCSHFARAPELSVFMLGAGQNIVWVERAHNLVAVMRWMKDSQVDPFLGRVMASLRAA